MNLFQKYGIKEVADVVFYSITRIDDEEFYTPVLYLDTLKVSDVEQSTSEVVERGGKTNRKVIGWNYNKDIKISLEDALFSPASMNFIWGGKFNSRLSLYTETIAKLNLANKYGRLNYSVKAKPSPVLTDEQWELVYEHAQKTYTASGARCSKGNGITEQKVLRDWYYVMNDVDKEPDMFVAENRYMLKKHYVNRTYEEIAKSDILTIRIEKYFPLKAGYYGTFEIEKETFNSEIKNFLFDQVNVFGEADLGGQIKLYDVEGKEVFNYYGVLRFQFKRFSDSLTVEHCYLYLLNKGNGILNVPLETEQQFLNYFYDYSLKEHIPIEGGGQAYEKAIIHTKNQERKYQLFELVRGFNNTKRYNTAMPQKVIDSIADDINRLSRIEKFEHNIENIQCLDRMEKCTVKSEYMTIDINQQKENFMKRLRNEKDKSYTIYYDYKTMLPLFQLIDDNIINFVEYPSYFLYYDNRNITDPNYQIDTGQEEAAVNALRLDPLDAKKICDLYLQTYNIPHDELIWDNNIADNDREGFLSFCEKINLIDMLNLDLPIYQQFLTTLKNALSYQQGKPIDLTDLKYLQIIWMPTEVGPLTNRNVNEFIQQKEENGVMSLAIAYWCLNYELKEKNVFTIKQGTPYYKWSRTVNKYDDYTLGRAITLDTNSFLGEYKIVGETYIRDQKTQKDQRFQITLNNTRLKIDNTLSLSADGEPSVFSLEAQVFNRYNQDMIELCQYDVEEDNKEGGYRIVPQKAQYTFTPTNLEFIERTEDIINNEIY